MDTFAPYDPSKKPLTPLNKSPLKSSNLAVNPLTVQHRDEAPEYNPQIQRRTIRVTADNNAADPLRQPRDSSASFTGPSKRFKDSYSLNAGRADNMLYRSNVNSPQPHFGGQQSQIDPEALKQLLNLQLHLQQNPDFVQQTQSLLENLHNNSTTGPGGSVKSQANANLLQTIGELERETAALRTDSAKYRQAVNELEYELETTRQQLAMERAKAESLAAELESHQELRDRLDEYALELQKAESERDFHHKNHVELRKELYGKTNADYTISKLKRDLHYKTEELTSAQNRASELEAQISELLLFAEKPRGEKQQNTEQFYTKKIVELENLVKKLKDEKFELENFHNTSLDNRKALLADAKLDRTTDLSRTSQLEIDTLKRRVETLKSENEYVKKQLETARNGKRADNLSLTGEACEHGRELEELRAEVRRLRASASPHESPAMADFYAKTVEEQKAKISTLQQEKMALQLQIDSLNRDLMERHREIEELRQSGGGGHDGGVDSEATNQLREANKRMTMEIVRLQDQLRRMDSLNKSSMLGSSVRERDWNKLLK